MLQAALNGSRTADEHPAIPRTPDELAHAARGAVNAGADVVHVHAYTNGAETFAADAVAATIEAIRTTCPGTPISLTTSASIEPDAHRRSELIASWTTLPDLVTANQGEPGIVELCEHLIARGVGIEAGLLSLDDANAFVRSGLTERCVRVLLEPLSVHPQDAVAEAEAMGQTLTTARVSLAQVHHGDGIASWAVNERAVSRGHGIRTGLEDTTLLPDGRRATDNAELVRVARALLG
jgi:uncharacterized protein (DUF849 family)